MHESFFKFGSLASKVTVSTWGRIGVGGTSAEFGTHHSMPAHLIPGQQDVLTGKRYFFLKTTETLTRLMAHRWASRNWFIGIPAAGHCQNQNRICRSKGQWAGLFVMDYDGL